MVRCGDSGIDTQPTMQSTGLPGRQNSESVLFMSARTNFGRIRSGAEEVDQLFEQRLQAIGLSADQISNQSLVELEDSLEQIDAAISKPEAFGVFNIKMTADAGAIIAAGSAESHVTYGILPLLLSRKRLIVSRIRELKATVSDSEPTDNMSAREGAYSSPPQDGLGTVFVVHGRDESIKSQVARVLERLQFEVIILEEQPNRGQTVIEKFQQNSLHVDFAVVLMTADDRGAGPDETLPKQANRARQNVILELGYFMGALGRNRVAALIAPGIEQPSDILGIAYIPMDGDNWKAHLAQELDAAGLQVDFNLLYR
jgi:predicted nucleotide-binding protein